MEISLETLSTELDCEYSGNGELILTHACGLDQLSKGGVSFIASKPDVPVPQGMLTQIITNLDTLPFAGKIALVVRPEIQHTQHNLIFSEDPLVTHIQITQLLHNSIQYFSDIHPSVILGKNITIGKNVSIAPHTVIYDDVSIGENTIIHANCVIMNDSQIGKNVILYPNVTLYHQTQIEDRVIIQSGAVIGADGHGYYQRNGKNQKIPQVGCVVLEHDVEIGACTTIDRARFTETRIKAGTKIDNQVQIAHNVVIGEQSLISAQTAVGGSSKTGHHLILGGQSGIRNNVEVGNHVSLAARGVITAKTKDQEVVAGMPGRPIQEWKQIQVWIQNLGNLYSRLKKMEEKIALMLHSK